MNIYVADKHTHTRRDYIKKNVCNKWNAFRMSHAMFVCMRKASMCTVLSHFCFIHFQNHVLCVYVHGTKFTNSIAFASNLFCIFLSSISVSQILIIIIIVNDRLYKDCRILNIINTSWDKFRVVEARMLLILSFTVFFIQILYVSYENVSGLTATCLSFCSKIIIIID